MNFSHIIYKTKTATEEEICAHLKDGNDNFCPPLDKRVNIKEYSKKIFNRSVTFEAWADHVLVGLLAAYFNDIKYHTGYITVVSIAKDCMGLGIASELMSICIRYAEQNDFKEIVLEVYKDNFPAIRLYQKHGFMDFKIKDNFRFMKLKGL